jgi:iron complex outermembrane receptor protein
MKTRFARSFFFSVAITSLTHPAHSADTDADAGDRNYAFIEEVFADSLNLPVVLTPSRMATPIHESPSAITVIDRELIRASGATSLVEVMRLVPGMVVGYEDSWQPSLRYHGPGDQESARHLQVLVDGRSVYQSGYAEVFWDWIGVQLEDIERIEVVRGPSTTTHGANAFSGTIQIITRHPEDTLGTQLVGQASNLQNQHYSASHSALTDFGSYRLRASWTETDGFDFKADGNNAQIVDTSSDNHDSQRLTDLNLQSHFDINDQHKLILDLGLTDADYNKGEIGDSLDPARWANSKNTHAHLQWEFNQDLNTLWSAQIFHNQTRLTDEFIQVEQTDENRRERLTEIEIEQQKRWSEQLRSVLGATWRQHEAQGKTWFGTNDWIRTQRQRAFGNLEWRTKPNTLLHLGLSVEHNEDLSRTDWSRSLAINHHITPQQTLRAGWSEANRYPDIFESHVIWNYPAVGNRYARAYHSENLVPEEIESFELGWNLHNFVFAGDQKLDVDLRLFKENASNLMEDSVFTGTLPSEYKNWNQVDDDLGLSSSFPETKTWSNSERMKMRGYDLTADWYPNSDLRIRGNYSRMFHRESDNFNTQRSVPQHVGTLLAVQSLPHNYLLSGAFHYVDVMRGVNVWPLAAWSRLDLRLRKDFQLGKTEGAWTLGMDHLIEDGPTPINKNNYFDSPTSWFGKLELKF